MTDTNENEVLADALAGLGGLEGGESNTPGLARFKLATLALWHTAFPRTQVDLCPQLPDALVAGGQGGKPTPRAKS